MEITPVVALVSSAGGLGAMREVIGALRPGFGAAVVALQHLAPDRQSDLPELLQGRVELPVRVAEDGARLAAGIVTVAPARWHTLVAPGPEVALIRSGAVPPARPSADLLLASLALVVGPAATAVVLTGAGHDGATGTSAIKRFGGRVLACDAATSVNFGMPGAAIGRQTVDDVLALPDIAEALNRLLQVDRRA